MRIDFTKNKNPPINDYIEVVSDYSSDDDPFADSPTRRKTSDKELIKIPVHGYTSPEAVSDYSSDSDPFADSPSDEIYSNGSDNSEERHRNQIASAMADE